MHKIIYLTVSSRAPEKLCGIYVASHATAPIVIFAHGLGSEKKAEKATALQNECTQRGWAFAAFDFHGHGESDGSTMDLCAARLLEDLDAIVHFARQCGHTQIFLVGSNMGGWAAAWYAAQNPHKISACGLIAPALRFLEFRWLSAAEHEQWKNNGQIQMRNQWIDLPLSYELSAASEQFKFDDLLTQFATPCLTIHGMQDDLCAYQDSVEFTARCASTAAELLLIKNGDHRLTEQKEFLAKSCCDFFARPPH